MDLCLESCPIAFSGANWSDEDINTSPILGLGSASSCCSYCNQSYGEKVKAYVYRTDQDSCHCKDQVNKPSFCPTCLGHNYNERKPPQSCNYRYNYEIFGFDLPGMPIEGVTQPGECCKRCQQHGSGHHACDEVEDSTFMGDYNPPENGQEVEQNVQLEHEVEQKVEEEIQQGNLLHEAQHENVLEGLENVPQEQVDTVEGIAEGMVVVEMIPDVYGEQENVNPNIMNAPIPVVGIPFQEGVAIGVLQEEVVNVQEPPILPPQEHDEIVPIDNDNEGLEVEVDGDGDVIMVDVGEDVGDGVAGEEIGVQEAQIGHRYPLRDTRARREYREREQQRRDRVGDRDEEGSQLAMEFK
eukprot:g8032.t1